MSDTRADGPEPTGSPALFVAVGASAALFAANLYYAQPLLTTIADEFRIRSEWSGIVVSASQFGYGLGLFLLVPLSDMIENRRLVLICSALTVVGLLGIAFAQSAAAFLGFGLMMGIFSSGAQVLIPYLSHLIPQARRGRVLASVMAGILASVTLSRPLALFVAETWGWRTVFLIAATSTAALGLTLWRTMPPRRPTARITYRQTIATMFVLFASNPRVRRRTLYQAILFGCFTMFWAAFPIVLEHRFGFGKQAIALFALVGAGGILAAPFVGQIADRGGGWIGTVVSSFAVAMAFACSLLSIHLIAPLGLALAAFVVDGSIQVTQILSRIVVLEVPADVRGRTNALYMTSIYFSGAVGSLLGVSLYFMGGWWAVAAVGTIGGSIVFAAALVDPKPAVRGATRPAPPND